LCGELAVEHLEEDIRVLLKKIDIELEDLEGRIYQIDETVEKDLRALLRKHHERIIQAELSEESIIAQYKENLKNKRIEALERAKKRLQNLKKEIEIAIAA
jgi:hypothetical protein